MTKTILNIGATIVVVFALLAMIEGALVWATAIKSNIRTLQGHTAYDANLGWKNIPGSYLPNYYGWGKYVRINEQGFRSDKEISDSIPAVMQRIVCSGDSFTFGEGVANDKVWCELLGANNTNVETVNMGVPGYGVDQAYLWYRSVGTKIEHNIHIFAFIGADIERMTNSRYHNYGKPILRLSGDALVIDNVPVPKLSMTIARISGKLKTIEYANRLLNKIYRPAKNGSMGGYGSKEKKMTFGPILAAVFREIVNLGAKKGTTPIFVYLPGISEITKDGAWQPLVSELASQMGLNFIDLTDALRALPGPESNSFFIPKNHPGWGHYSEAGNIWVAEQLKQYMEAMLKDL